jgi:ABC-type nitrate/sulfonate/bicarbonate transport system permease component
VRGYVIKAAAGLTLICVLAQLIGAYSPYAEMRSLPVFTLSTVTRITLTLALSVAWGVSFGILAATNRLASFVVTPVVDLLQSIPILGYFPLVIGFLAMRPPATLPGPSASHAIAATNAESIPPETPIAAFLKPFLRT